ncbi:MAG: AAA family ATPase, partial [Clostridia bacterium]|nr:AAA family ATPase [Clostridia bacterium]
MKINSLNIVSFGKLKNLKIDFSDNLNIVYGDNEAGKTHIAEFIKVMFYGSGSRGKGENNLRKRYKPWDGSKMGGSVDFTHSGKRYRLEREFKASSATDSVTLWDLDLGTSKSLSGSDNIGEQFFGISLGAFQQSVFIDNSVVFSDKGDGGELNMRLANLMNSADEDVSFDKVLKNLTATRDKISPKRTKNAPLPEAEQQLFELTEKKRESESLYREALESQRELELLSQKAAALQAEKTELFERLKQLEVCSQKKNLTEFFTALKELEDAEKALKTESGRLTAEEVSALEKELHSLKTNSEIFSRLQAENLSATEEIASLKATPKSDDLLCSLNAKAAELTSSVTAAEAALTEATNDAA